MGGGLVQLVAYGYDNMYLTYKPQVTFFKVVYRRHTNFSIEQIPQYFTNPANFAKKSTCTISKNADCVGGVTLVVELPSIPKFSDPSLKFAWVKKVGFALIKTVEIEINGKVIDTHYGEWLNLWAELTGNVRNEHSSGFNKTIGNVPELTDFTNTKNSYLLFIPLQFWFCRNSGSTLPIVSLQYCDIKLNVEFEDAEKCYLLTPTHSIQCRDDIVAFTPYEYIEQNIDGDVRGGIFIKYDIATKTLYYHKITKNKLLSIPVNSSFDTSSANSVSINALLNSTNGLKYVITGKTSGYTVFAELKFNTQTYPTPKIRNINFANCFFIVDYYFLDEDERTKFAQSKHDYIIEQLYHTPAIELDDTNFSAVIVVNHPCKLMVWVSQLKYIYSSGDLYNYTNSYQNKLFKTDVSSRSIGEPMGNSLIVNQTILMNGNPRLSMRNATYFEKIQPYQYSTTTVSTGINMYSFSADPFKTQPLGTCNMSQIDKIEIKMKLLSSISVSNPGLFRGYCVCVNILRIVNGLAGLVFS